MINITTFYSVVIEIIHLIISLGLQITLGKGIFHLTFIGIFNIAFHWAIVQNRKVCVLLYAVNSAEGYGLVLNSGVTQVSK